MEPEEDLNELVVFTLDRHRFALWVSLVERVVRAVEVTPLPGAPDIVMGAINVQGEVVPVIDIRKRFNLPRREIRLTDQMIIAATSRRSLALLVDRVEGITQIPEKGVLETGELSPGAEYVEGVVKEEDGSITVLADLERFLTPAEEEVLGDAMRER